MTLQSTDDDRQTQHCSISATVSTVGELDVRPKILWKKSLSLHMIVRQQLQRLQMH